MATILVVTGIGAGTEHEVGERIVIGREPRSVDLLLEDRRASREHAEVVREGDSFTLRDLGSLNGTYVDGRVVKETALKDGSKITIGSCQLLFRDEADPARAKPESSASLTMVEDGDGEVRLVDSAAQVEISAAVEKPAEAEQIQDLGTAQRLYKRLQILFDAAKVLGSTRSLDEVLDEVMRMLLDVFPAADRSFITLQEEETGQLVPSAARTRKAEGPGDIVLSRTIVNKVMEERRAILSRDTGQQAEFSDALSIVELSINSFMCVPLIYHDEVLGILQVDSSRVLPPFTEDDLKLLSSLASQAALAIKNARDDQERQLLYLSNIGALVKAVEARDEYTRGHSMRVAEYATLIGRRMNRTRDASQRINLDRLRYAGQLHDAGKINVTQQVLHKPSKLNFEEYEQMKRHPIVTHFILSEMHLPPELKGLDIIAALHHERFDGNGYPCGFKGDETPIESRILAAADTFDAMTSDRPYRKALQSDVAMAEVNRVANTQLDPDVVVAFTEVHKSGLIDNVLGDERAGGLASLPTPRRFRQLLTKLKETLEPGKLG